MKVRDVRLPTWLKPESYIVEMKPDIYQDDPDDFTNTGTVKVTMTCINATNRVTIHSNKLNVTNPSLTSLSGEFTKMCRSHTGSCRRYSMCC